MESSKSRGIALISALIITTFLVALTGAFMAVNAGHFAILRNSEEQTRARRAAQAGLEYATYSLEHERQWGTALLQEIPTRGDGRRSSAFDDFEVISVSGRTMTARYKPLEAELRITVENNLGAAPATPHQVKSDLDAGAVPAEHARIRVEGQWEELATTLRPWFV